MIYRLTEPPFATLLGEGVMSGIPMILVRLAGCSVHCPWCDTKNSWDLDSAMLLSGTEINHLARQAAPALRWVLLTGGEPTEQYLEPLCMALRDGGWQICLETSGTQPPSWGRARPEHIVVAPKLHAPPLDMWGSLADEVKLVIGRRDDIPRYDAMLGQWLQRSVPISLQPEHGALPGSASACVAGAIARDWRVSIQIHKLMGWMT